MNADGNERFENGNHCVFENWPVTTSEYLQIEKQIMREFEI